MKYAIIKHRGIDVKVFENGDIYSCERLIKWRGVYKKCSSKKLTQHIDKYGYCFVRLNKDGRRLLVKVHRLVAEAFLPNKDNLPSINHKNEVKSDNRVENLEWCSVFYNNHYNDRYSKMKNLRKPVGQYSINGEFVDKFSSIREAAIKNNYSKAHIGNCCNNRVKTAYGYIWKFE